MRKSIVRAVALAAGVSLVACAAPPRKEDAGTVLGGVAGGVAGAQMGRGHGKTAAIIVGTILGAIVGRDVGRSIDRTDELQAQQALERNKVGQASSWVNPDTGNQVVVTPTKTYQVAGGDYCREFQSEVTVGGKKERAYGTACRQPDGSWKIVDQR
ncbi:MAG: RT0821/Lpp0805 family surface protein [Deferrisomatales bacterium]